MTTYISILRGINVSGAKKIVMSDLKTLYEELGFKEVTSYIQSGNVIYQAEGIITGEQAAEMIKHAVFQKYQFDVPVLVRKLREMQTILRTNPFLEDKSLDIGKLHVTFLSELPKEEYLASIKKYNYSPDLFFIAGKDVFLYCPNGYGTTKLSNSFFEDKLKVSASTRNWRTVNMLVEIASQKPIPDN
jgi:uncharacterized protein (DUF1697 family)